MRLSLWMWVVLGLCVVHGVVEESKTGGYEVSFVVDNLNRSAPCELLYQREIYQHRMLRNQPFYVTTHPQLIREGHSHDEGHHHVHETSEHDFHIIKVYAITKEIALGYFYEECRDWFMATSDSEAAVQADEVIPLVYSGLPGNRVDLVFMGDGYTLDERQTMIDDMTRLVNDMFTGTTFTPYLPLFNVWIVFRPSAQSGIGVGGVPRNTAFRLYRDGTQLRGVYCGDAPAARSACTAPGPYACDFPTLIGNSPFYGGLGGEFTISTSSVTSGTIVLRHELGHNFGSVGEEYDGGSSYFGANFANSVATATNKWRAWLSEEPIIVQDDQLLLQDYPWYLLENGPRSYTFTSNGNYKRWYLSFTASGVPEADSFSVYLDGELLELKPAGTEDRTFYKIISDTPFTAGTHQLLFRQNYPPTGQYKRQLCSLNLHEYMNEPLFHWEDFYSAYKTWRIGNTLAGYRPTNEYCLMRNMSSPYFCDICKENMWLQFFQTVSAIDNITQTCDGTTVGVKINVIPLAQFRSDPIPGEQYQLRWTLDNSPYPVFDDIFQWKAEILDVVGVWRASLTFITPEVRQDPNNLLTFELTTIISDAPCLKMGK